MVRRVKAYLKSMKVITNEEELHKMSMECEPPLGGLPPPPPINTVRTLHICPLPTNTYAVQVRKRNPSPSPSAVSSASSTPSHYSNNDDKRNCLTAAPNKFGKFFGSKF